MDIFEIIMNAVDDFDEKFENVLEALNNIIDGNRIDIDEAEEIVFDIKNYVIDISAEDVSDNSNKIHIRKIDDN